MEFFLVLIFLYSAQITENTDQKKQRIWALFTQCMYYQNFQIRPVLVIKLYANCEQFNLLGVL